MVLMTEYEKWIQRFIGAYAALSDDLEEAEELSEQFRESEYTPDDCPIESARATWGESKAAAA